MLDLFLQKCYTVRKIFDFYIFSSESKNPPPEEGQIAAVKK